MQETITRIDPRRSRSSRIGARLNEVCWPIEDRPTPHTGGSPPGPPPRPCERKGGTATRNHTPNRGWLSSLDAKAAAEERPWS